MRILVITVLAGTLFASACSEISQKPHQTIDVASSLQVDARISAQNRWPIIIFVSQNGCEFCHLLREQVLHPMIVSGELQRRAILREVSLDDGFQLNDFSGESVSGREFAERYAVSVTPTLLFLDGSGREVGDQIVGISNIEYYGFYLDQSIKIATTEITEG